MPRDWGRLLQNYPEAQVSLLNIPGQGDTWTCSITWPDARTPFSYQGSWDQCLLRLREQLTYEEPDVGLTETSPEATQIFRQMVRALVRSKNKDRVGINGMARKVLSEPVLPEMSPLVPGGESWQDIWQTAIGLPEVRKAIRRAVVFVKYSAAWHPDGGYVLTVWQDGAERCGRKISRFNIPFAGVPAGAEQLVTDEVLRRFPQHVGWVMRAYFWGITR